MSRSVFISGAARGIGRSTALTLARRSWTVGAYDLVDDFAWVAAEDPGRGGIHHGHLDVTDPESWSAALEDFASHTGGRIDAVVNIASAAAIYGTPDMAVYSTTKFAVRGLTEALNLEWEQDDITVSAVWPLYAKTGMLDGVATSGTKRMGVRLTADDVAEAVANVVERERGRVAKVHHPVGLQAKIMYAASHFSPAWLIRFVNAKFTTDRPVRL
ncbi:SDR family NAD(P)-dependent oxidoreductase [Corynebacterium mastitidis]